MNASTQGRGLSAVPKQAHANNPGHSDTIRKQASKRAHKTRNRPFGIVERRIARVELWVEMLKSLEDCAHIERRCGSVIGYCANTRNRLEAQMMREQISVQTYHRHSMNLDRAETQIAWKLIRHAAQAESHAADCKALAAQAELAAQSERAA